jgi:AraC family transcriptional regulator, transcriptional activator of pobA
MKRENLQQFFDRYNMALDSYALSAITSKQEFFKVYRREEFGCSSVFPSMRTDFYKISLVVGKGILKYTEREIELRTGSAIVFSNPDIPYIWEPGDDQQRGYFCVFNNAFLNRMHPNKTTQPHSIFASGSTPVLFLTEEIQDRLSWIFEQMIIVAQSDYPYKNDLLFHYLSIIIHEALKIDPPVSFYKYNDAATRIAVMFTDLLAKQFPIESPRQTLTLRKPVEYADKLSVHVNHLNHSVKQITGKTTTQHISEKIFTEALIMLTNTNWTINEVAHALGFEHPSSFTTFFRKHSSLGPLEYRQTNHLRLTAIINP